MDYFSPSFAILPEERIRETFHDDLHVLNIFKPLLYNGNIISATPPPNVCSHCLVSDILSPKSLEQFAREQKKLSKRYLEQVKFSLSKHGLKYNIEIVGSEELIPHGHAGLLLDSPPDQLQSMPRIMSRLDKGEDVVLSKTLKEKLKYHERESQRIFSNVSFEILTAQALGASFITDRKIHIDLISSITSSEDIRKEADISLSHLSALVPFLGDVPISDLIKLRKNEAEAFEVFRASLKSTIEEYKRLHGSFTVRLAEQLYGDVLSPALAKLDKRVKSARKSLVKVPIHNALSWTAAISFGAYTGYLPNELLAAASGLGMIKVLSDLTREILSIGESSNVVEGEEMFFLWQVKKRAKRKKQ